MSAVERAVRSPDIVLTVISNHVDDISTLLAIRHTCGAWLRITTAYEKSISQLLVQKTFRKVNRSLSVSKYGEQYTTSWLIQLMPRCLAAVLVDRHRTIKDEHMFGIPVEDPLGDPLRARVANGFRILRKLSIISQEVHLKEVPTSHAIDLQYSPPPKQRRRLSRTHSSFMKAFTSPDITLAKRRETITYEQRKEYIQTLSPRDQEDYQIMSIFIIGCFEHLWMAPGFIGESAPDGPLDFGSPPRHWIGRKDSWANWYILHHGPEIFWRQWLGRSCFYDHIPLFRHMEYEYSRRSKVVRNIETGFAQRIEKELQRGLNPRKYNPPPELMPYQNEWQRLRFAGHRVPIPPDTLGCISFRVDEPPPPAGLHRRCQSLTDEKDHKISDCSEMQDIIRGWT